MGKRFMREDCRGMDRPGGCYNRNILRYTNANDTAAWYHLVIELSTCQVPSSYLDFHRVAQHVRARGRAIRFFPLKLSRKCTLKA